MEVWRVISALFTLLSTSLTAHQFKSYDNGAHSFFSTYSWLAGVLGTSSDFKCILDRPLLVAPALLKAELNNSTFSSSVAVLQLFLSQSSCCGCDLEQWDPPDWVSRPSKLSVIEDSSLIVWAHQIHQTWQKLGRQVSRSVLTHPERSSLLYLPHPFILPSPEAREVHYWESYWLVLGLLLGGMRTTARMHILNLAALVDTYGFIPSGGRVYLTSHSEPPVLAQMVELYYKHTSDLSLVKEVLPSLLAEYKFWMKERSIRLRTGTFNMYKPIAAGPRPGAYEEDKRSAMFLSQEQRGSYYNEVAASMESGWSLSSRWSDEQCDNRTLFKASRILPVDLNALLAQNELTLYRLCDKVGQKKMAEHFLSAHQARCRTFSDMFWSKERELWLDVDLNSGTHREGFYASSLVPLLWGCKQNYGRHKAVLRSFERLGLLDYPGGIPASLSKGSEWDFPYAIAPLQWFPVLAWHDAEDLSLRTAAKAIAQRWVASSYLAWRKHHVLFDKYLCTKAGSPALNRTDLGQTGFGWSSGVLLHFLTLYPDLSSSDLTEHREDHISKETLSMKLPTRISRNILTIYSADGVVEGTGGSNTTDSTSSVKRSYGWVAAPILLSVALVVLVLCLFWCRWLFLAGETRYWRRVHNEHLQAASSGGGGGGGGGGGENDELSSPHQTARESSEEFDEHNDSDRRELFTWDV